ncbi:MAG TPA: C40 family peptidase [Sphingobium sp.]|nr:C40 family peptidase [Sphingobium sp.]
MNANKDFAQPRAGRRISFRLNGRSLALDRRVNAIRGDLADISLAGILFAPHYARALPMHCIVPGAFLRESGSGDARAASQILAGETFHVLDVTGAWAWGFCDHDGYVGYVERDALATGILAATHQVSARTAPVFATPDIKSPVVDMLPAGSRITGEAAGDFVVTATGAVHVRHLLNAGQFEIDWVAAAERQIGQPYVWGGRGQGGIDCSGLVQLALGQAGVRVPRDTDLQRDSIGTPLADDAVLERGDVVFFPGHVGIMLDAERMLHANAWWMNTIIEPLSDVVARLEPQHEHPILARRRVAL